MTLGKLSFSGRVSWDIVLTEGSTHNIQCIEALTTITIPKLLLLLLRRAAIFVFGVRREIGSIPGFDPGSNLPLSREGQLCAHILTPPLSPRELKICQPWVLTHYPHWPYSSSCIPQSLSAQPGREFSLSVPLSLSHPLEAGQSGILLPNVFPSKVKSMSHIWLSPRVISTQPLLCRTSPLHHFAGD